MRLSGMINRHASASLLNAQRQVFVSGKANRGILVHKSLVLNCPCDANRDANRGKIQAVFRGRSSVGRASRSQCEGREFDPHRLHHYLKARHALALFLRGLSPEFTGLFPALRIQGGHRSVHFHPAAPLNSSLFSVCAKVVLRIIEKFSERRRGAVCAVFRLPVAHRFKCRPRRLARLPPVSEPQPDNAAITARCASQSSGSSRRMKNSSDSPTGSRPRAMSSINSGARRASFSVF